MPSLQPVGWIDPAIQRQVNQLDELIQLSNAKLITSWMNWLGYPMPSDNQLDGSIQQSNTKLTSWANWLSYPMPSDNQLDGLIQQSNTKLTSWANWLSYPMPSDNQMDGLIQLSNAQQILTRLNWFTYSMPCDLHMQNIPYEQPIFFHYHSLSHPLKPFAPICLLTSTTVQCKKTLPAF